MPITYTKQSHTKRLIEPFFSRFRQKYRGTRNSKRENLEMNSLLVDFNRINKNLDLVDTTCNSYSNSIIGSISSLVEAEVLADGVDVQISGVSALIVDKVTSSPSIISINDMAKISGKITRLTNKIKYLENRI